MKTYLRHKIRNVVDVKDLIALESLDFEGKYRDYEESHDFWELCYGVQGEITLLLDGKRIALSENKMILLPPNKKHAYFSLEGNQNQAFVVCFDSFSQVLDTVSGQICSLDRDQMRCLGIIMEEFSETFRMNEQDQMEVLPAPHFGGQQAILLQLEYLLISVVRKLSLKENSNIIFFSDARFNEDLVKVVIRYLRENMGKKITLTDICDKFSYSKSFLCRLFKEQTGKTIISYLNDLRMEEGKRLLCQTTKPVKEIAGALGFREVKYFDATFKKYCGMTPVVYRINNQK